MNWLDLSGMKKPDALASGWSFHTISETISGEEIAKYGDKLLLTCYSKDVPDGKMLIVRDHINLSGINPLRGHNDEDLGVRFPDMSHPYALPAGCNVEEAIIIRAGQNSEHPVDAIEANEVVFQTILAKHQKKTVYAVIYGNDINANAILKLFQGE
jgi:hypothetical protein